LEAGDGGRSDVVVAVLDGLAVGGPGGERWRARHQELSSRDPDDLDADQLEELARACFWLGRPRDAIAARQRAYGLHLAAGDHDRAARVAWQLFHNHHELDETSAASGWLARAQRHVDAAPDSAERGYVAVAAAMWAGYCGEMDDAVAEAALAHELGQTAGDRDLVAWGLAMQGGMTVMRGDVADGMALLDEAMVEASFGDLSPFVTGWVYCFLLKICQAMGDVRRAGEWTDTAVRWCERQGVDSWYPGLCRLHRCEVASWRGEWVAAEQEALRAADELAPFGNYLIAEGQYLAGEIRRRWGDRAGAEAAFRRAHELGHAPQPGMALLQLDAGDAEGAVAQLRTALLETSPRPLTRARLLAAHVRATLATGDRDAAEDSAQELAELADATSSRLLEAMAAGARGAVRLAAGDLERAVPLLREAATGCRQLDCPYEVAEVQVLLGRAARAAGDEATAALELEAARATFERLGARPDAERAAAALAGDTPDRPAGLTDREAEVLRLLAEGGSNRDIAEALVISEHTVRRHLSNLYRKIGVTTRSAATAFAFEHDLA
jgi:ATP/maltotriose-dependent transcriptional regulator MalT